MRMLTVFVAFDCFSCFFCDLFIVFRGENGVYGFSNEDFQNEVFYCNFFFRRKLLETFVESARHADSH